MSDNWIQSTLTVNDGIELFYTRTGGEKKPMIVLAHGLTDKGLCWRQLGGDLQADYDLIMVDAYGHGKSSRIDPDKRFDLVEDLHDLIETLGIEKPAIIGHSMGASTAAGLAAAYPDRVAALVLEDPPWTDQKVSPAEMETRMQDWKKRNLAAKEKTGKALIQLQKRANPNWEEAILEPWAQAKLEVDPAFFDNFPRKTQDWRKLTPKIKAPTLIITGDHDLGAIVTPQVGIDLINILEKGEFGHISAAGHCVRYEQYQPFLNMVKTFLKRNLPS